MDNEVFKVYTEEEYFEMSKAISEDLILELDEYSFIILRDKEKRYFFATESDEEEYDGTLYIEVSVDRFCEMASIWVQYENEEYLTQKLNRLYCEIFCVDDIDVEESKQYFYQVEFDTFECGWQEELTDAIEKYPGGFMLGEKCDTKQYFYSPYLYYLRLKEIYNKCAARMKYIIENDMYINAAQSKNYVDTWLFLALHFICALRNSDIVRIHHPRITMKPEEVLKQVIEGNFSDEDARLTLYSITWRLTALPLTPNKTRKHSGISSIKLYKSLSFIK